MGNFNLCKFYVYGIGTLPAIFDVEGNNIIVTNLIDKPAGMDKILIV